MICVNKLCKKVCSTGNAPGYTCPSGQLCEKLTVGTQELPCKLGACFGSAKCNMLTDAGCPSGTHQCVPAGSNKACMPVGTKGVGAACTEDTECAKGLLCMGASGKPKGCLRKCHSGNGSPKCPSGQKCYVVTVGPSNVAVGDSLGVCST